MRSRQALGVEDLAAQRQHGLRVVVAALLRRAAGRVAFDDEQLGLVAGRSTCSRRACRAGSAARLPGDLRFTSVAASRDACRALRRQHDPADDLVGGGLVGVQPRFQAGRTKLSTVAVISGLLSLSLVCPWNCGSRTNTDSTPTTPSRMSSAVIFSPLILMSCVSM